METEPDPLSISVAIWPQSAEMEQLRGLKFAMYKIKQMTISMDVTLHVRQLQDGIVIIRQDREANAMRFAEICLESAMRFVKSMILRALFALAVKASDLDVLAQEGVLQLKTPARVAGTGLKIQGKYVTSLFRRIPQFQAVQIAQLWQDMIAPGLTTMFLQSFAQFVETGMKTLENNVITLTQLNVEQIVILSLDGAAPILSTRELIVFHSVETG